MSKYMRSTHLSTAAGKYLKSRHGSNSVNDGTDQSPVHPPEPSSDRSALRSAPSDKAHSNRYTGKDQRLFDRLDQFESVRGRTQPVPARDQRPTPIYTEHDIALFDAIGSRLTAGQHRPAQ